MSGAIRAAYRDTLPKGRFPVFCLFINVPPEFIDVNVHPGKTEVRFQDNALIRSLIVGSISRELHISYSETTTDLSKEALKRFNNVTELSKNIQNKTNQSFFEHGDVIPSVKPVKNENNQNVGS